MCDLSTVITVIGGIVSIAGQIQEGNDRRRQEAFNAAVARNNQIIADRAAVDAKLRGEAAAARQGEKTRQFKARQRTALAAGGVVVDEFSALDLTTDTSAIGREEEAIIRRNAEREALGFTTQGLNFGSSAELADLRGRAARREAGFGAFGTLLTTAGTVARRFRVN